MSLLLFGILYAIARTRSEAVALASQATRELRTQLSFTQQLIEAMPNPVFFKDRAGRYLGCNRAFEEFVGSPRDGFIGHTVTDIATPELAERSMAVDAALLAQPGAQAYEASMVHARDGLAHDVLVNKATFVDPGGESRAWWASSSTSPSARSSRPTRARATSACGAVIHAAPLAIIARDLDKRDRACGTPRPSACSAGRRPR